MSKFTVELDSEDNPDAVGEFLRSSFFNQKNVEESWGDYRQLGCYQTFEWREDVEPLDSLLVDQEDSIWTGDLNLKWTRGQKNDIECRWYWDGDGTLAFHLPDGKWLVNVDCKKNYEWNLRDSPEDF